MNPISKIIKAIQEWLAKREREYEYLAGQTGTMEFATTMEKVRLKRSTQQTSTIET